MPSEFFIYGGIIVLVSILAAMVFNEATWWWQDRRVKFFDPEQDD